MSKWKKPYIQRFVTGGDLVKEFLVKKLCGLIREDYALGNLERLEGYFDKTVKP